MNRKIEKYRMEATCPITIYGSSTGCLPIHVRIIKVAMRDQNIICLTGRKVDAWLEEVCSIGIRNQTSTAATSAMTPPSFFGIDRRMAYAKRKYHSG